MFRTTEDYSIIWYRLLDKIEVKTTVEVGDVLYVL